MKIRSISHKGLRRLIEDGAVTGLPANSAAKIEAIITFLISAADAERVQKLQAWKAHQLRPLLVAQYNALMRPVRG